jgi:hypothetical protein
MLSLHALILFTQYLQAQADVLPKSQLINLLIKGQAGQILDFFLLFTKWNKLTALAQAIGAVLNQVIFSG